jgi:uracil-DNA glycosylase
VLVFLGATAAKSLLGSSFRLTRSRGEELDCDLAPHVTATIHPAAILRAPDDAARKAERAAFVSDLEAAAAMLDAAG